MLAIVRNVPDWVQRWHIVRPRRGSLPADKIGLKRASQRRGWVDESGQPEESPRVQRGALSRSGGGPGPEGPVWPLAAP